MKTTKPILSCLAALWLWPMLMVQAAPSIGIVSPSNMVDLAEGDEFSKFNVGEPWDMNQLRDIPYEYRFYQPSVQNGIWTGITMVSGASAFSPLYKGPSVPIYTNYSVFYTEGMPYGKLNPIDASRYSRLAMRLSLPQASRTSLYVIWYTNVNETSYDNSLWFEDADLVGLNADGSAIMDFYPSGFRIYDLGFSADEFLRERVQDICPGFGMSGSWMGTIFGLNIQPTRAGPANTTVQIDWIRLYNPNHSPVLHLAWESTDIPTNNDALYSVQLWVDTDAAGYDGDLFMTGLKNDGAYEFNLGALPAGDYYIYLKAMKRGAAVFETLAVSGYSPRVRVLSAPMFEFTAPSYTSGVDYAGAVLDNPWDMTDAADLNLASSIHISNPCFGYGTFYAIADPPVPPATESDAQVHLNTSVNGQFAPIDPNRFRYLTYRVAADAAGYTNFDDRITRGWVTRLVWANTTPGVDGAESQPFPLLEDWHSYTIDMWDPAMLETEDPYPAQIGWRELGSINWIRLDPLEVPKATIFAIEDVKLCAENTPCNNIYVIRWLTGDTDSSMLTVALSCGYFVGANFVAMPITTFSQVTGPGYYIWDTSRIRTGRYLLRAEVFDGTNVLTRYSRTPVVIDDQVVVDGSVPVPRDYSGDGYADQAVYNELTGYWYIPISQTILMSNIKWGDNTCTPVPADYDGDGKADIAVYQEETGYWYVYRSSDYGISFMKWGESGYAPVPADYDGDGKADVAVYHEETGYWWVFCSSDYRTACMKWGESGYAPASADYDGDGKTDIAVYQEYTGYWFIFRSSHWDMAYMKYGQTGYAPAPADYNGDGVTDIAVYQRDTGQWYYFPSGSY